MSTAQQAEGDVTRRRSPIMVRCALVVISVVLTLLVLEGALRLVFYLRATDIRTYQPSFIYGLSLVDRSRFFQSEHIDYLDLDALLEHNDFTIHVDPVHWALKGLDQVADRWTEKIITVSSLRLNQFATIPPRKRT